MIYDISIFAKWQLFGNFLAWRNTILSQRKEPFIDLFDDFLFRAYSALIRLERINNQMVYAKFFFEEYRNLFTLNCEKINYWSPFLIEAIIHVNPYLSNFREMQNKFLHLIKIQDNVSTGIPLSINDAMKKIDKYGFSKPIVSLMKSYWSNSGKILKKYRDLEQHISTLVKHSYFRVKPSPKLMILLPDNPEETKAINFTFKEEIEVFKYFKENFDSFHSFVENITKKFGFDGSSKNVYTQSLNFLFPEVSEVERTFALWLNPTKETQGFEIVTKDRKLVFKPIKNKKLTISRDFMGIPKAVEIQGYKNKEA